MTARVEDINGWPEIKGNPLSKVGVFPYLGRSIDLPGLDPDKFYNVLRPADELSSQECIESFRLVPWIDEHTMLGESFGNAAESKGVEGVIGEDVYFEYPYLRGNIKLFSDSLGEMIDDGKADLSCGYRCKYTLEDGEFDGTPYQVVQRQIRGNHVASVDNGRMGKDVAVLDAQEKLTFSIDSKEFAMADAEKKTGEDEKSLEALYEMVGDMSKTMDACMKDMAEMKKGKAKDAEEEDSEKKKAEDEKAEADEKCADEDGKGEDSMASVIGRLKSLESENATLKSDLKSAMDSAPSTESVVKTIKERDALAGRLSRVVGTFDHSDMVDANSVAKYGVKKLSIACDSGNELVALDAYLQANPAQQFTVHTASDSDESDGVSDYINGK
jgi:hypothetical protein